MRDTGWLKSTRSTSGGDNCVEVRITGEAAWVRDSKNPAVTVPADLTALLAAVKTGRLDR